VVTICQPRRHFEGRRCSRSRKTLPWCSLRGVLQR
jgi:hypothetical protein